MPNLLILNIVGLTPRLVGPHTPRLAALARAGSLGPMHGVIPAVTCSAQATMLTGLSPQEHGIVGNGWLHRDTAEVRFWLQSHALITGEPLYVTARRRAAQAGRPFSVAKLFWWFNQGAAVDVFVTPKPHYGSDGSKVFDILSGPADLAGHLQRQLGTFPFAAFWGPMAGESSTRWIAQAAALVLTERRPTLSLVYLPHLDYDLQRHGTADPQRLAACLAQVDTAAGVVLDAAAATDTAVMVVSEYGLATVRRAVYINRALRREGLVSVRGGPFGELPNLHDTPAFAVADHQVAHVYVHGSADTAAVARVVRTIPGVARVWVGGGRAEIGLDHPRAGDIVALAEPDAWFAYPYWLDDDLAPDFARCVDIHRKPGYDPCELLFDPHLWAPKLRVARRVLAKLLGFRYRMDVIPLQAELIAGSHGLPPADPADGPVLITPPGYDPVTDMTAVKSLALTIMGLGD